jgi:hypothetical protein
VGKVGSIDMWTSHVHRQNLMSARVMFRAVMALQYPKHLRGQPLLFDGDERPAKGGVPGLRTLITRLKENWATVEYALLSDEEASSLLTMHCAGLHYANDRSVFKAA